QSNIRPPRYLYKEVDPQTHTVTLASSTKPSIDWHPSISTSYSELISSTSDHKRLLNVSTFNLLPPTSNSILYRPSLTAPAQPNGNIGATIYVKSAGVSLWSADVIIFVASPLDGSYQPSTRFAGVSFGISANCALARIWSYATYYVLRPRWDSYISFGNVKKARALSDADLAIDPIDAASLLRPSTGTPLVVESDETRAAGPRNDINDDGRIISGM
ncbi:hypothetical protein H0H93_005525, partial [Arthromyces matolae]